MAQAVGEDKAAVPGHARWARESEAKAWFFVLGCFCRGTQSLPDLAVPLIVNRGKAGACIMATTIGNPLTCGLRTSALRARRGCTPYRRRSGCGRSVVRPITYDDLRSLRAVQISHFQ
jgi:hypothetical protein